MSKLETIAGRLAHAVGCEQTPDEMLESASLVAELAHEVEALQNDEALDPQSMRQYRNADGTKGRTRG